jgi:hypothetical protein
MRKRKAGQVGSKPTAARKRDAVKDLSARKARRVVGGLLPAVRSESRATPKQADVPLESVSFSYSKIQF